MSPDKRILHRSEISTKAKDAVDLAGRYQQILTHISTQTGFTSSSDTPFSQSTWWGKKIGAVMFRGSLSNSPAVLKIEGVKTEADEATETEMIKHAKKALAGSGIRPPEILGEIPWTDLAGGYSAVFMEDVRGAAVLPVPGTKEQINDLLVIRDRYRQALKNNAVVPWIANEGTLSDAIVAKFANWQKSSQELFPNHPLRKPEDAELIQKAITALREGYKNREPEFMQGHFSHRDIVLSGQDIVMFSNLYWSYRAPLYDLVFPYHWYMLELAGQPGMTIDELKRQQGYWDNEFSKREQTMSPEEKRLFKLARIERLAAAINLDALSITDDTANKTAAYVVDMMRGQLQTLLSS